MKVPYNYLPFEFNQNHSIYAEWKKLIKSSDFTLGKYVKKFEDKFATYTRSKFCVSTNNGTDALILSLKALNVGAGDEVISVSNSFYATTGAIVAVGANPVLVDCDERYQINIDEVEKKITKKTKVILPVHWAGASPDMLRLVKIARKYKIYIVEDACMGIGGKVNNKHPGTFGNIGAFSMHPLKSLNVMGDGGMIVTNDRKIYQWILKYRNHGMIDRDNIDIWGVNYRLQPLQAIVAINRLKDLDSVIRIRNNNAQYLDRKLLTIYPNIKIPKRIDGYLETFSLYMLLARDRNKLLKELINKGIEAKVHYPIPLHKQKAYLRRFKKIKLPVSESQSKKLITLPIHQFLKKNQLDYMVKIIKNFYSTY